MENWEKEYKIIIADNQFITGGAKIQFIGNKNDLKNLTYYEVNIIKGDREYGIYGQEADKQI